MSRQPRPTGEQPNTRPSPQAQESAPRRRTIGEDAVPVPSHTKGGVPEDFRKINGWGADLDPKNRPSFPKELPSKVMTVRGDVKHWQTPRSRIHISNEHPGITPVFGDTIAPRGLSGALRDYAYQFGEATNRHWLTLMLADRIDVWEHALLDMLTGRYVKDKGFSAKAKYEKTEEAEPNEMGKYAFYGVAAMGALALAAVMMGPESPFLRTRRTSRDGKSRKRR